MEVYTLHLFFETKSLNRLRQGSGRYLRQHFCSFTVQRKEPLYAALAFRGSFVVLRGDVRYLERPT
jgi:hypothetical protein